MSQSPMKRYRPSTRSTSVSCLVCQEPQVDLTALNYHCRMKHTKKQMIEGIVNFADKSRQELSENKSIEYTSSNSHNESSSSPIRNKRKENHDLSRNANHGYNFRTPSSIILKQRNNILTSSPSSPNSNTSNSSSPSAYFTPDQSLKQARRRKQRLDSLMFEFEDDSNSKCSPINLIKLPPCTEIKEGIKKLKEQEKDDRKSLSISKLDSDTDSCSDIGMPSVYCSSCSNGYQSIENLEAHVLECSSKEITADNTVDESLEVNVSHKVYICYFCDQEFNLKQALEEHLDDHLGENIMTDITQMENDFDLRPETNFVHQYYNYFTAGYNFGVTDKGTCTNIELQFQFYENLFRNTKNLESSRAVEAWK